MGLSGTLGVDAVTGKDARPARRFDITPGWLISGSWSRRLLDGTGSKPFVLVSVSLGVSGAWTREEVPAGVPAPDLAPFYAIDLRAGLTVGKTFFNTLSPYGAARVYGGPVIWKYDGSTTTGGDRYHFQLAVGLVTALPKGFDLYAEVAPGGERGVTVGGGKSF